jgi:anti-sigma factor RsiW
MIDYPPGFTCDLIVSRLERYIVGTLPRAEALAVAEHLEACSTCAHRVVPVRLTASEDERRDG